MNKILSAFSLMCLGASVFSGTAYAEGSLVKLTGGNANALSRSGAYVAGAKSLFDPTYTFSLYRGFTWNAADGLRWASDDENVTEESSALFLAVNNAGMTAGAVKDLDMRLPAGGGGIFAPPRDRAAGYADEEPGAPINHAAVWRDGKKYVLPGGLGPISDYADESDGTYAAAISDDGNVVAGYAQRSFFPDGLYRWTYDAGKDAYDCTAYSLPSDAIGATMTTLSADGSKLFGVVFRGSANGSVSYPAVWTSPSDCRIIDIPNVESYDLGSGLAAASADGSKALVYGSGYVGCYLGIYDVEKDELTPIAIREKTFGVGGIAVCDNGDAFVTLTDENWSSKEYFYDHEASNFVQMQEYIKECAADVEGISSLATASLKAVSGDGLVMLFSQASYGYGGSESYVLTVENAGAVVAPAPADVRLVHNGLSKVTCVWKGIESLPESLMLKGYEVTIDGSVAGTFEATEPGGHFEATVEGSPGVNHSASVKTIYLKNGVEQMSESSDVARAYVSAETELVSFDNFDDCPIDRNGDPIYQGDEWAAETIEANPLVIAWATDVRDWDNNNPFMCVTSISETPWASALVNRYHDASDATDFFLSFYARSQEVNEFGQDRTTDFLDVEYTLDGLNWETLFSICAADMPHSKWNFFKVDLGDKLGGKVFRLRFKAHGEGNAMLTWAVDCIGVNDVLEAPAPEGLRLAEENKNSVEIEWKNSVGAWDASYVVNSFVEADANVGNQGVPFMTAIDLTPDKVAAHADEYITGVSAFLYDIPELYSEETRAEAVVYEDGKEVARSGFDGPFSVIGSSTAWLQRPVLIQKGKTYRVAVNITRHDPSAAPLYYQIVPEACVPGVTDLYSEDDGRTWMSLHDVYAQLYPDDESAAMRAKGDCVWSIHANISSEATPGNGVKDPELIGYNVYRDGVKVNKSVVYGPYMRFKDNNPEDGAVYSVQAFYRDGRVSPLSEPFTFKQSGVENVGADSDVTVAYESGNISVAGNYDRAVLYALNGIVTGVCHPGSSLTTSSLAPGLYLLRVTAGDRSFVKKIIVK